MRSNRTVWTLMLLCVTSLGWVAQSGAQASSHPSENIVHKMEAEEFARLGSQQLTGAWMIDRDLSLTDDTHVLFHKAQVRLRGNLFLSGNAQLSIEDGGVFNLAQTQSFSIQD